MTIKLSKILAAIFAALFSVCAVLGIYFLLPNSTAAYADDGEDIETIVGHASGDCSDWTDLNTDYSTGGTITSDGKYYLSENLNIESGITIGNGTDKITVYLCLNGNILKYVGTGYATVITVKDNATFYLCDCGGTTQTHYYHVSIDMYVFCDYDGSSADSCTSSDHYYIKGGVITGGSNSGSGGGLSVAGTFYMYSGTIAGNYTGSLGGGVYVSGTFTMNGGEISGNTAAEDGGGVYVNSNATFTMEDGAISGNFTNQSGGGVAVYGTFTMKGGAISGNIASGDGGGVAVESGMFTMDGGTISGNIVNNNSNGVRVYDSIFTINGGYLDGSVYVIENNNTITIMGGALSQEAYSSVYDTDGGINYIHTDSESKETGDETWCWVVVPSDGTSVNTKEATCMEEGYTTYTYTIDWQTYTLKVNITAVTDHSFTNYVTSKSATCTATGTKTAKCDYGCGETKTQTIAKTSHTIVSVSAQEATETEDGNITYYKCTVCGKYFEDASGKTEITDKSSVTIPATGSDDAAEGGETDTGSGNTGEDDEAEGGTTEGDEAEGSEIGSGSGNTGESGDADTCSDSTTKGDETEGDTTEGEDEGGLSAGAIVGIVIGCIVGVVVIGCAVAAIVMVRKRRKN